MPMPIFNADLLERMLYDMPERAGLSVQELARRLGKGESTLGRELNPDDPGAKLGVVAFALLTAETSDFEPLDYLEQCLGRVAFTLPRAIGAGELHRGLAAVARESADVLRQLCEDLADGKMDEPDQALKEIAEAAQALAVLRALVIKETKTKGCKPPLRSVRGQGHGQ